MELRRFKFSTDNKEIQDRVENLLEEKGITRKELMLLLGSMEINYEAFAEFPEVSALAAQGKRPDVSLLIELC